MISPDWLYIFSRNADRIHVQQLTQGPSRWIIDERWAQTNWEFFMQLMRGERLWGNKLIDCGIVLHTLLSYLTSRSQLVSKQLLGIQRVLGRHMVCCRILMVSLGQTFLFLVQLLFYCCMSFLQYTFCPLSPLSFFPSLSSTLLICPNLQLSNTMVRLDMLYMLPELHLCACSIISQILCPLYSSPFRIVRCY